MRTTDLILALVLLPTLGSAQTTPTEIAAAADVLARIKVLQEKIAPEETAREISNAVTTVYYALFQKLNKKLANFDSGT